MNFTCAMTKMPYINLFLFYTRCFSNKTGIVIGTPIRSTHRIKTVSTAIYITYTPNIFCIFITFSFILAGSTLGVFSVNFCPWPFFFCLKRKIKFSTKSWDPFQTCFMFSAAIILISGENVCKALENNQFQKAVDAWVQKCCQYRVLTYTVEKKQVLGPEK